MMIYRISFDILILNIPGPDLLYRLNKLMQTYDSRVSLVADLIAKHQGRPVNRARPVGPADRMGSKKSL